MSRKKSIPNSEIDPKLNDGKSNPYILLKCICGFFLDNMQIPICPCCDQPAVQVRCPECGKWLELKNMVRT